MTSTSERLVRQGSANDLLGCRLRVCGPEDVVADVRTASAALKGSDHHVTLSVVRVGTIHEPLHQADGFIAIHAARSPGF
ncbi:hypothetical protein [Streptomyces sp. b94]|uniref:hypothetical protein n=1 Tax=Streptomyces sp. b94 TaxID=1827634 RepID=UPI001B382872|nr:hypothetical protein [Streptomyces sp. b94]